MNENITEVVFILDASGSMYELTADTIGGFNSMLKEQKEKNGSALVSTVTFNTSSSVVHDRLPIGEVPEMTDKDYRAGGGTALIDAIGGAIHHIERVHRYIRKEDVPARTLFIITTDGMENSSHKYTSSEVKKKVEAKKKEGWEFIFLAENIDAAETAASFGISRDMAVEYRNDSVGTGKRFRAMSMVMDSVCRNSPLDSAWKEELEEDVKNRN